MAKAMIGRNAEALAKSLEERRALKGNLIGHAMLPSSSSWWSLGRRQVPARSPSGWRRFQMRFEPSSPTSYSMGRQGC